MWIPNSVFERESTGGVLNSVSFVGELMALSIAGARRWGSAEGVGVVKVGCVVVVVGAIARVVGLLDGKTQRRPIEKSFELRVLRKQESHSSFFLAPGGRCPLFFRKLS